MSHLKRATLAVFAAATILTSCSKNGKTTTPPDEISADVKAKVSALGLDAGWMQKAEGGYLIEGDIFLSESRLDELVSSPVLRIAETEQYRTFNLVTGLPRVITISVTNLPTVYSDATNEAIRRYNTLGLQLTFQRVQSGGAIDIIGFNQGPSGGYITLGSSGFPTSSGNPYNQVKMNTNEAAYGSNPNLNYVASVLQHEIGHCIGFRHTDYMDRSYSCGGRRVNEEKPKSGLGAVLIPGTPSGPDANSFMLACSNGSNRTFNANDIIALNYLY
ncbi:M57 family metalloprotease [Flavihumibacter petaseus]|uniref:Peptidase M57 family protein n=1 Tax=Flavihumibacter petaseus NBRC 106054 TaxID=1220578 RepID=A0A0E9MZQ2_9BACT|nr:M57 family metalloprotease [Flavihumibacter petaseus]GAO42605.1 peptidase M57 family protein [Flavihumibacter petaseus NBRC 106054]